MSHLCRIQARTILMDMYIYNVHGPLPARPVRPNPSSPSERATHSEHASKAVNYNNLSACSHIVRDPSRAFNSKIHARFIYANERTRLQQ